MALESLELTAPGSRRAARLVLAFAAALLLAYTMIWSRVSAVDVGRSDFTSTYVGGTLFREGHRADLYAQPLQARLHSALIAPDREGNLPYVDAPAAAAVAAPVTLLPLDSAYRVWGALQILLLVAAVVIAVSSAPWPAPAPAIWKAAVAAASLALAGTLAELLQAQWTPVLALGVALAYRDWRRGRLRRGAMLLVVSAGVAKPHLALALAAFMLGWRNRELIKGALTGALAVGLASLALVGVAGMAGFAQVLASSANRWEYDTFVSFLGLAGTVAGNSTAALALGAAGSLLAVCAAFWLGSLARSSPERLSFGFGGAVILTVLASPHALPHDLTLLAPAAAWSLPAGLQHTRVSLARAALLTLAGLAAVLTAVLMVAGGGPVPTGALLPLPLAAVAGLAATACVRARDAGARGMNGDMIAPARLAAVS